MRTVDYAQPRRATPKLVIDWLKEPFARRFADLPFTFDCLDPNAGHRRINLAAAVSADAAARPVAHLLAAIARASHTCRRQHALATHLAIEH